MYVYFINNFIFFKIVFFYLFDSYRIREKISKNFYKDMKVKGRSQREKNFSMLRDKSREGKIRQIVRENKEIDIVLRVINLGILVGDLQRQGYVVGIKVFI